MKGNCGGKKKKDTHRWPEFPKRPHAGRPSAAVNDAVLALPPPAPVSLRAGACFCSPEPAGGSASRTCRWPALRGQARPRALWDPDTPSLLAPLSPVLCGVGVTVTAVSR